MIIKDYLRAGYPLLWLQSHEPDRVTRDIVKYYEENPVNGDPDLFWDVWKWDVASGWVDKKDENNKTQANNPLEALKAIPEMPGYRIFIMEGFHKFLDNPVVIQTLKNLRDVLKVTHQPIIFVSPEVTLPIELQKDIVLLDYNLPNLEELMALLGQILTAFSLEEENETTRRNIAEGARGLSLFEAENAFALAIIRNNRQFNENCLKVVLEEKQQIIKKSGFLDYEHSQTDLKSVGGLGNLKDWLKIREKAMSHEAREYGLPAPKGILLVGVPGTGKSLAAKSIAKSWNLPLIKFDVGRIFGSLVGQSESNVRSAIKTIEAIGSCVVWIDEIEKAMAGSGSSGQTDSGVTARVMGNLLTWMQEKQGNSFVVATANQVQNLPPEMLRKGRWDEIFSVDLPSQEERKEILEIHLSKRNKSIPNLSRIVQKSKGFTGAEIEQIVIDALYLAFSEGREVEEKDIFRAINETTPLSVTMKEQITALREWAKTRTRPAAKPEPEVESANLRSVL